MAPKINLTLSPGACSIAPHILLREAGLDFTTTVVKVKGGFPKEYLKLNPKGRVPFLQIDNQIITENPAVMTAISQLAPEKNLLGETPLETVRCYEWMNWLSGHVHGQGFGGLFRPQRFIKDEKLHAAIREKAKDTITECFVVIDEKLEGKTFALGDDLSVVDAYLLFFWKAGAENGWDMKADYPNYARVMGNLVKRAAVVEVVKFEDIETYV